MSCLFPILFVSDQRCRHQPLAVDVGDGVLIRSSISFRGVGIGLGSLAHCSYANGLALAYVDLRKQAEQIRRAHGGQSATDRSEY